MVPIQDVVILGAGGLGRESLWTARCDGSTLFRADGTICTPNVLGFLDDNVANHGRLVNDAPVLGGVDWLNDHPDVALLVAIGSPSIRCRVVSALRNRGASFVGLIAGGTIRGDAVSIGIGSILLPRTIMTCNITVGEFALLNPGVTISHDCVIGEYTSLGPGVHLAGAVRIGARCDIGTGASAIPGSVVGDDCIVGAGACVVRDIPSGLIAVGVPARVIHQSH